MMIKDTGAGPSARRGIRGLSSMVEQVEVAVEERCYGRQLFDRRNFVQDNVNRGEIQDDGYRIPDTRYQIPDTGYQIPDMG